MQNVTAWLVAHKAYAAGIGLMGLALYQLTNGDYEAAGKSFLTGLGIFGIRYALPAAPAAADVTTAKPSN